MTTRTTPTPEQIADQLEAAEAEAQRLRAKQSAIAAAEHDARHATELRLYREAYGPISAQHREARDAAQERLTRIAGAEVLDMPALLNAFLDLKTLDAHCAAIGTHASRLDQIDPLPRLPNGAERTRPGQVTELYQEMTWSQFLDQVTIKRTDTARAQHLTELQSATHATVAAAVEAARIEAAALADGQQLDVETPPSITELHQAAAEKIDESTFDEDKVRSAGPRAIRHIAETAELEQLVRAGN